MGVCVCYKIINDDFTTNLLLIHGAGFFKIGQQLVKLHGGVCWLLKSGVTVTDSTITVAPPCTLLLTARGALRQMDELASVH